MILNNTQANIFKVNGGIADNFANRPAANGSFYIFYSIDTQEIFYDNGAWVLLGSGGGGVVNIYNSDGTLTGNRKLFANNFQLTFQDINILEINGPLLNNGRTFVIDNTNKTYQIGDIDGTFNRTFLEISDINPYIKTSYGSNDIGLKLDFANNNYQFGDGNTYYLSIDATNQNISLNCNNVAFSIYADNINKYITIGQTSDQAGFTFYNDFNNGIFVAKMGDPLGLVNECTFSVDSLNQIIKTTNQTNDIGLKLDFANNVYTLSDIGYNALQINGSNNSISAIVNNGTGLLLNGNNFQYKIGDIDSVNNVTQFIVDDTNQIIKTTSLNIDKGLKLDFANTTYQFGQITGGNITYLNIDDAGRQIYSLFNNLNIGFFISGANNSVLLGNMDATNKLHMTINDNLETAYFSHKLNTYQGLFLNFNNYTFQFGRLTGGNNTYLQINDAVAYPIQLNGTNVLSVTSGGSSGQHLKIKVNGVDYKIRLDNP